ncbi:MAG TPA: bifunctional lytic transglycosylase/C40 family peptidase [Acidimicrobiales bacterium]|nr:bifunctional lytic transglycosylase/C40 family peptidase [Acidimicrobiales bacterium]
MREGSIGAKLAWAGAGLVLAVVLVAGAAGAAVTSLLTGGDTASSPAAAKIPPAMLGLYRTAAATCPGLPWTVLAAIGTVESANGTSTLPGVASGANPAGAEGPMQMEPATFAAYAEPIPPGGVDPPSPYDATDAVYAAARDLCANGARNGTDVPGAVYAYNHSDAYVGRVVALAQIYGQDDAQVLAAGTAGGIAADWALAQVGTPYIWGGETPGVGFDCSGLVQAAYAAAGVNLPRTAQEQYDAGTLLPPGTPVLPGDLVVFGSGPGSVTHVGIVVGAGQMVDAPHAGARVRVEAFPGTPGAAWGDEIVVGFARPWP